jgi:hypothetical protein
MPALAITSAFSGTSSQHQRLVPLATLAFVVTFLSCVQAAHQRGILYAPPVNGGDEDSYERLGYNVASGLGFGFCPSDQSILEGRSEPMPVAECQENCSPTEFAPTAYRPPGFPFVVAAIYRISPLNFIAVRLMNCVFCAMAVAISAVAFATVSRGAAFGLIMLISIDSRFREFAGTFLTENLATLTFCLFAISLTAFLRETSVRRGFLCGLALSALVFTRSFYVAWYPALWICVAASVALQVHRSRISMRVGIRVIAAFAVACLVLTGPWWIRNCLLLKAVMPTGTQGGIGIADGFSDSAWQNFGSWTPTTANQILERMKRDPELAELSPLELEKEHARQGADHAKNWIRQNLARIPQLSWWKLSRLWECGSLLHTILFVAMFVGLFATRSQRIAQVMLLLLLLNSLTVMATYHTYERFFTPFRPLIHGFAICGVQFVLQSVYQRIGKPRSSMPVGG